MMEVVHKIFLVNFSRIKNMGIHPGQCAMISILDSNDGITQKEIAECMHIKPPTVAVAVKRLEKIGLVIKKNDGKDMRKTRIYIAEKGREIAKEIEKVSEEVKKQIFKDFTESEICLLKKYYIHMLKNLQDVIDSENMKDLSICCDKE